MCFTWVCACARVCVVCMYTCVHTWNLEGSIVSCSTTVCFNLDDQSLTEPEAHITATLDTQRAPGSACGPHPPTPVSARVLGICPIFGFYVGSRVQTETLTIVQQVLYPSVSFSHLIFVSEAFSIYHMASVVYRQASVYILTFIN